MDLVYDDGSKDLFLQSLTMTIIIQKILEDEGMRPNCERDEEAIASRTKEVVNNLPVPLLLKLELRRMVLPIMKEMQSWYQNKDEASRVVLTQNGTVDLQKSIRNMLNDKNVSLMQRFKVVCYHCLEQEIFDLGAQINFPHTFGTSDLNSRGLDEIWFKIYEGNFHAKLGRKDISEDYCTQGFAQAFYTNNSIGVKYFLEGASPSKLGDHIVFSKRYRDHETLFAPDVYIKMFKRLNEYGRQQLKSYFSADLLIALLQWPYQHQFLRAAESLTLNMDSSDFWSVAARIARKARVGWEDHDYKGLFIDFWKLGSEPKTTCNRSKFYARDLLYNVILMRDKRLAHLVLDNTTEEFKTQDLFNCHDSFFLRLIFEQRFEALELFMEVCRVNNDKLIIKLLKDVTEYLDYGCQRRSFFYCIKFKRLNSEEQKNIIGEFLSRMDKLKPQMSEISI